MNKPKDMQGNLLAVGQKVAHPAMWGRSAVINIRTITKIDECGKLWLDKSNVCIKCPERLLILKGE